MNILILDKNYNEEDRRKEIELWGLHLQESGHEVALAGNLSNHEKLVDLNKYRLVITHPSFEDAKKLYEEVRKRKDFAVYVYSHAGPHKHRELAAEKNVWSSDFFDVDTKTILEVVKKVYNGNRI